MQYLDYSTDIAAKGETHSHNICIPISLTQVQRIQGGFTQRLLRLVRKPPLPVRVRVHPCRWNPEPGFNRSHLIILLHIYSRCQNINSLSKIVVTVVWLRYCRYGISQSVLETSNIFLTKLCLLLFMLVGLYVIRCGMSGISIPFRTRKMPPRAARENQVSLVLTFY